MFRNLTGKLLKFANHLAADYYTKDQHKVSQKSFNQKGKRKEEANKPA